MIKKANRNVKRQKRHGRIRMNVKGTPAKPRLSVYRSGKHIYAQLIDDISGNTLVSASTLDKDANLESTSNIEAAKYVGEAIGKRAIEKEIKEVVFDRSGYIYHGRIKAVAEGAREAGLKF